MSRQILIIGHSGDMYGASRSLLKLVTILNPYYKVYVLIPETGSLHKHLKDILPAERIFLDKGLYIFTRKSFKFRYLPVTIIQFLKNLISITRIIRKYQIDIIHTNSGVLPAAALAAKLNGVKHIWHIREWFGDFNKFWPIYSSYMTTLSDKVICVSKTIARQFPNSVKVHSIYNGFTIPEIAHKTISTGPLRDKLQNADLVIGCTSRLKLVRKGQEYLIEALGILAGRTDKRIHIVFIGDYVPGYEYQRQILTDLIQKFKLEDRIHFLGQIPDPLIYYKLFDVFVLPSGEPEPFGGVVMEAMSMGLPIIGSKGGGTTEQVEDGANGYLFEMKNPSDLASKIELFLNDDQKAKVFGACSKQRMHKYFSLQLHEKNILELYNSI